MTTALAKAKAKRARRPVYGEFVKVAVLETGEERIAFIAAHPIDRRLLKERGWKKGDEVRAEFKRPRNVAFHRLAHAIGALLVDNVEGFETMDAHDAIKRVQRESGVCCEEVEIDIPGMGKLLAKQAESLSFDEMTAERFETFFNGITDYIDRTYLSAVTDDVRAEYLLMVEGDK